MSRVLCVTLEPIAERMAGPAIRCLELARQLSDEFEVTVFSPRIGGNTEGLPLTLKLVPSSTKKALYQIAQDSDIIFLQANVLKPYPKLGKLGKYLIVDLYDPFLFSVLAQYQKEPVAASASYRLLHQVLQQHMAIADFCVCASERQRDYWIGRFCAQGRLTPELYGIDPTFRKLIDIVPFGLPDKPPVEDLAKRGDMRGELSGVSAERTRDEVSGALIKGIRGFVPGIAKDDEVLVWGGGMWEWLDPLTVIAAVEQLSKTRPKLRLFFMGWKSPNPQVELMQMAKKAKELADKKGLTNSQVFFFEGWVPYEERSKFLLDADIAVSAHFDLPETRYAFRTRLLDYFWAGLPIVTTSGDELAEMIEKDHAGITVPYQDVGAWARAIENILQDQLLKTKLKEGSRRLASQFTWGKVAAPLVEFCRHPYHLPSLRPIKMPSLIERAAAVYARGGKELLVQRSRDLLSERIKG